MQFRRDPSPSRAARARQGAAITGLIMGMGLAILLFLLGSIVLLPLMAVNSIAVTIRQQTTSTAQARGTAQAAPTATAAAAATQTSQASLAELPPGAKPFLIEAFDTNANRWPDSVSEGNASSAYWSGRFAHGQYILTVTNDDDSRAWWASSSKVTQTPESFTMNVDARQVGGEPDGGYGLFFSRSTTPERWVIFLVADNGYFTVLSAEKGTTSALARWSPANVHAGDWNLLTIRSQGGHTWFFVNRALVFQTDAIKEPAGDFGMVVAPHDVEEHQVEFDNLSLYSLEK